MPNLTSNCLDSHNKLEYLANVGIKTSAGLFISSFTDNLKTSLVFSLESLGHQNFCKQGLLVLNSKMKGNFCGNRLD